MDDNHALGIFGLSSTASKALRDYHSGLLIPTVKIRNLSEAGRVTQLKAQRLIGKYSNIFTFSHNSKIIVISRTSDNAKFEYSIDCRTSSN